MVLFPKPPWMQKTLFNEVLKRKKNLREPAVPMNPVEDPAGWFPIELKENKGWIFELSQNECNEILEAVLSVEQRGLEIKNIRRSDFMLSPVLSSRFQEIRDECVNGRGLALLRGLPVALMSRGQIATALWGVGTYLGVAVSQNGKGHLLGHVKDLGGNYLTKNTRGYFTNAEMGFHADRCDYVGLLCLQTAKSGGESCVASSVTLYNEMLRQRPDLVAELLKEFCWSRTGEIPPGKDPFYKMPVFSFEGGHLSARGVSKQIYESQGMEGVDDFTEKQLEALTFFKEQVKKLSFEIDFRQGDLQFLCSHVTLHTRRSFKDWEDPSRKRHLLRLWLHDDKGRPIPKVYREIINGIKLEGVKLTTPLDV